ncbi:hypothetical protein OHR68_35420 [Spirillospora sp. NBC_00431]
MFALRMLVAVCGAPLVAAAFTGVAYLAVSVHPRYFPLGLACVALALGVGAHAHHHFMEKSAFGLGVACGVVLVVTAATAYALVLTWVAPRHMCTVVEARTWHRLTPGGEETYNYRRLACDDGSTDRLDSGPAEMKGNDTTDKYGGDRVLVAFDPNGNLPSMAVRHRFLWLVGAGAGMVLVVTIHTGVVVGDQRRRRAAGTSGGTRLVKEPDQ